MAHADVRVAPILLGPANCEAACGMPWRHVRDHARELGVEPVHVGRKLAVPAAAFIAALERHAAKPESTEAAPADPAAALRERLGLRLAGGAK